VHRHVVDQSAFGEETVAASVADEGALIAMSALVIFEGGFA
jgi:hypothetical protein